MSSLETRISRPGRNAPRRITFSVVQEDTVILSVVARRADNLVHVRITGRDSVRDFTFKSLGSLELDRRAVFLLTLIASRLGRFKLNCYHDGPLCNLKKQLEESAPELVDTNDSPTSRILSELFFASTPVPRVLPASAGYVEKLASIVRERIESGVRPKDPRPDPVYAVARLLTTREADGNTIIESIMYESLERVYGKDRLLEDEKLRIELGPPENYFQAEQIYVAIRNFDRFSSKFNRLVKQLKPAVFTPLLERSGNDYRLTLIVGSPGSPTVTVGCELDVRELARLLRHVSAETGKTGVVRVVLEQLAEKEKIAVVDEEEGVFLITEPGKTITIETRTGSHTVHNSFPSLKKHLKKHGKPIVGLPYETLVQAGPGFYGSKELMEAVGITGCPVCEDYELVNGNIAVARTGDTWHAGLKIPGTGRTVHTQGSTRKNAILALAPLLFFVDEHALSGVEKHAPGLPGLVKALKKTVGGPCLNVGNCKEIHVKPMPVGSDSYDLFILYAGGEGSYYDIAEVLINYDEEGSYERARILLEDPDMGRERNTISRRDIIEELLKNGYRVMDKHRGEHVLLRNDSIYVLMPGLDKA